MADVTQLNTLLGAYGIGVRAGTITPQIEDEEYFRKVMDLPEMSKATRDSWAKTDNVRRPITLQPPPGEASQTSPMQTPPEDSDA